MTDFEKQQFERQKQIALDSFYEAYNPKKLRQNHNQNPPKTAHQNRLFPEIIGGILGENPTGDTALVGAVLMLLISAKADPKIILALLYIIM